MITLVWKSPVIPRWLTREKTCWFWSRKTAEKKQRNYIPRGKLELSLQWKSYRKKRDTLEQHGKCGHVAAIGNTTYDSHSWRLEETPGAESEVRADCSSHAAGDTAWRRTLQITLTLVSPGALARDSYPPNPAKGRHISFSPSPTRALSNQQLKVPSWH